MAKSENLDKTDLALSFLIVKEIQMFILKFLKLRKIQVCHFMSLIIFVCGLEFSVRIAIVEQITHIRLVLKEVFEYPVKSEESQSTRWEVFS